MQKKLVQFILCVIISALFFSIWSVLLSCSKNEPINVNICVIIPAALGIGWGSFKVIFKKIGVGGFKSLGELLRLVAVSFVMNNRQGKEWSYYEKINSWFTHVASIISHRLYIRS